jgi:hypothetical protein
MGNDNFVAHLSFSDKKKEQQNADEVTNTECGLEHGLRNKVVFGCNPDQRRRIECCNQRKNNFEIFIVLNTVASRIVTVFNI